MHIVTKGTSLAALAILAMSGPAVAIEPDMVPETVHEISQGQTTAWATELPEIAPEASPADEVARDEVVAPPPAKIALIKDDELGETRGGQTLVIASQTLQSLIGNNVINGDYEAGDINISNNALSQFTGMGNFVFNTGAQSSLQAGMNVSVNVSGD